MVKTLYRAVCYGCDRSFEFLKEPELGTDIDECEHCGRHSWKFSAETAPPGVLALADVRQEGVSLLEGAPG